MQARVLTCFHYGCVSAPFMSFASVTRAPVLCFSLDYYVRFCYVGTLESGLRHSSELLKEEQSLTHTEIMEKQDLDIWLLMPLCV